MQVPENNLTNSSAIKGYEVRRFDTNNVSVSSLSTGYLLNRAIDISKTDSLISEEFQLFKNEPVPTVPKFNLGYLFEKKEVEGSVIKTDENTIECDICLQGKKSYIIQLPKSFFPKDVKTGMAFLLSLENVGGYRKPIIKPRIPSAHGRDVGNEKMKELLATFDK